MCFKFHLQLTVIGIAVFVTGIFCQLPCDSPLRLRRPEFFKHCDCSYGDWSEWEIVAGSTIDVPISKCESGEAYSESRQKKSFGKSCPPITETRQICLPDVVDRLIAVLGLGSVGRQVYSLRGYAYGPKGPGSEICPENAGLVCTDIAEPHKNKRSAEFSAPSAPKKADSPIPQSSSSPQSFNMHEHGRRLRRMASPSCSYDFNAPQHILFLLDTSGSIGNHTYQRMKDALSKLVYLFCEPIQVGVMTFNQDYKLEFCFNCFDNDLTGREQTVEAIKNLEYRSGWTHTGGAAKCVCDRVLHPSCGVPTTADCINVVFLTDGKSNDPSREICNEVKCLHNRLGVNTYAIGVNGYDPDELKCITQASNLINIFKFQDFDEFVYALEELDERLFNDILNGDYYACYDPQDAP